MKKKSLLSILTAIAHIAIKIDASLGGTTNRQFGDSFLSKSNTPITTYTYDLDPLILISQNVNEKGLVVMNGQFNKPFTSSNILLSIKQLLEYSRRMDYRMLQNLFCYNHYNESYEL